MIKATIVADSISAHTNTRITTMELEYPRFIHSEIMTHRQFSRNASSSRAIPIDKMIEQVQSNPATPIHWGLNQSGMQAEQELPYIQKKLANALWIKAKNNAISIAKEMKALGLHKQIVNRVLEPFQIMKTLVTSTDYDNFFNLRLHKDAQPEIQHLAKQMYQALQESVPLQLHAGQWHLPYITAVIGEDNQMHYFADDKPVNIETAIKISCSCSAQVSYRKNDTSIKKAIKIYDKLIGSEPKHLSPFEHCATPIDPSKIMWNGTHEPQLPDGITHFLFDTTPCSGNFTNWVQYRQLIPNHDCKNYRK